MQTSVRHADTLPGPRGLPWLGNALQLDSTRLHQKLEAWGQQYGAMYKLRIGARRIVVVSDHTLVASVLRDRPEGFRRTVRLEEIWLELGLPPGVFGVPGLHEGAAGFDDAAAAAGRPSGRVSWTR